MTINNIVSNIRLLIKQYSDDSIFTDESLYNLFNDARISLLSTGKYKMSKQDYLSFCVDLEESQSHLCNSKLVGYEVLKSKHKIPAYLDLDKNMTLKVSELGGKIITLIPEQDVPIIKYNKILNKKLTYSIINGNIVIWKNCKGRFPKSILVEAVWQDILDWNGLQCSSCSTCLEADNIDAFTDKKFIWDCYKIVTDLLRLPLSLKQDPNDINPNG